MTLISKRGMDVLLKLNEYQRLSVSPRLFWSYAMNRVTPDKVKINRMESLVNCQSRETAYLHLVVGVGSTFTDGPLDG